MVKVNSIEKHKKHPFVPRPELGQFTRCEWGFIGAPCDRIEALANALIGVLQQSVRIAYIDAEHGSKEQSPGALLCKDMITHQRIDFGHKFNHFDYKFHLRHIDLGLINGNHFASDRQIVIINHKKKDSLRKKLDRLTDVRMIIYDLDHSEIYEFLSDYDPEINNLPSFRIDEVEDIAQFLINDWQSREAKLKGLVLSGGKSARMGKDKSTIDYHGIDQQSFMAGQMLGASLPVFISKSVHPMSGEVTYPVIIDTFSGLGPYGAILSAFREDPNSAWFIVACDQPLLMTPHLLKLLEERDPSKAATCYHNPETGWPEPLMTIWEPKSYPRLLEFLSLGYSCPRKFLINSDVKVVKVEDTHFMKNANTSIERDEIIEHIQSDRYNRKT